VAIVQFGQTGLQVRALDLKAAAGDEYRLIRNDLALTETGRRQALARKWVATRAQVVGLQKQEMDQRDKARASAERAAFGVVGKSSADAISFRDAQDRATALASPEAALKLLALASISGDTALAKAIALRAFLANWGEVIDAYTDIDPTAAARLAEIADPRTENRRKADNLASSMAFAAAKPSELSAMSVLEIEQLAEGTTPARAGGSW